MGHNIYFLERPWGGNHNRSLVEPGTEVALIRNAPRVLTPADGPQPGSWKTQTEQINNRH